MALRRSPGLQGKASSIEDSINTFFSPSDPTDAVSTPSNGPQTQKSASTTNSPSKITQKLTSTSPSTTSSSSQSTPTSKSSSSTPTSSSSATSSSSTSSTASSSTISSSSTSSSSLSSSTSSTFSQKSSSTTLSSSSLTQSATTSTSALPAATTTPPTSSHSSGSDGTKIAMGIVGGIIAISLLILALFWIRRSKRNRKRAEQQRIIDELPIGDYQKMRDSTSDIHESPVFQDERDPAIRRQRLGAANAIPMTDAGAWGSLPDQQARPPYGDPSAAPEPLRVRKNSFDNTGSATKQLNQPLPALPRKAIPPTMPTPPPQSYVAYKPFSQAYRPPDVLVAGVQSQQRSPPTPSNRSAVGTASSGPGRQQGSDNGVFELSGQ